MHVCVHVFAHRQALKLKTVGNWQYIIMIFPIHLHRLSNSLSLGQSL